MNRLIRKGTRLASIGVALLVFAALTALAAQAKKS